MGSVNKRVIIKPVKFCYFFPVAMLEIVFYIFGITSQDNVLVALSVMFVYYPLMDTESSCKAKVRKRKAALNVSFCVKKERNTVYQKVRITDIAD